MKKSYETVHLIYSIFNIKKKHAQGKSGRVRFKLCTMLSLGDTIVGDFNFLLCDFFNKEHVFYN